MKHTDLYIELVSEERLNDKEKERLRKLLDSNYFEEYPESEDFFVYVLGSLVKLHSDHRTFLENLIALIHQDAIVDKDFGMRITFDDSYTVKDWSYTDYCNKHEYC